MIGVHIADPPPTSISFDATKITPSARHDLLLRRPCYNRDWDYIRENALLEVPSSCTELQLMGIDLRDDGVGRLADLLEKSHHVS